ncbi:MAG: formylmethanofuran dehydrogenase subunit E family protein [ANME-2 cluster archaeon]|nr:formylmethanofuran dehydrogenase subunit E family protein [ANME-2 cluster archaeon]
MIFYTLHLADAMQSLAGCTLGQGNIFIEDYGKLA